VKFSNSGTVLSGASGYAAGSVNSPYQIAIRRRECLDYE
jgi:hypothetical protein